MRAKQALRPCVMLLVACPLTAAIAQPTRCDTLPAYQREFARAIGACRDLAPIIDIAPPVETTPSPAPPVPDGNTEAMPTPASPGNTQAKKLTPKRTEARKSTSKPAAASAKSAGPSKTAASRKSESERRNEPLDTRGWQTYQDDRYTFRYPADLVTASHRNGVVELHSVDREFRVRASARINSKKDTVQSAWQQRLKEHGRSVTYKRKGDGWFVVSGVEGGKTYYRKQFVSPERMAELVITYPKSRASVYDPWVTEIEKSFVAYRASDGAQASSSTEPQSVVTMVRSRVPAAACAVRRFCGLRFAARTFDGARAKPSGGGCVYQPGREQRRGRAGSRRIARPAARRRAHASSASSAQSRHRYSACRTCGYCAGCNRQPGGYRSRQSRCDRAASRSPHSRCDRAASRSPHSRCDRAACRSPQSRCDRAASRNQIYRLA